MPDIDDNSVTPRDKSMLEKQGQGKTSASGNGLHLENLSDPKIRARPSRDHTVRDFALTIRLLLQQRGRKRNGMSLCRCKLKQALGGRAYQTIG
jgi:hypothetical protein